MAAFYSELLVKNGSTYTMTNMTDPDEFANAINGGGYSLPLVAETLKIANTFRGLFGLKPNKTWGDQAENIYIPRNAAAGIISEYDGMNGSAAVKQADIVLNTFPLNYQDNYTAEDSRNDLEYYATRQDVNGPGMTWAIYAIVSAEIATAGCASYTYQQYSVVPFARAPFFQFSEQINDDWLTNGKTHPAFPFLTGHGGANQAVIFGYLGLRLTPSFTLHVDPSLPPQIPNLKYRKFYWQGWPIQAIANQTHTTLTRLSKPYETANMTYANASIPVQRGDKGSLYQLPPTGSLVLENRRPADTATIDKNIAQCLPISSPDAYVPGQFPLSAVDGEASTKWQPTLSNTSQALTVSLASQPFQPISGFYLDFAQTPPANFTILLHNTSSITSAAVRVTDNHKVVISHPYNETEIPIVRRYSSNTTNITLENPVYSGTHATLLIEGNLENKAANATGATVAEWAILGTRGEVLDVGSKERKGEKFFDMKRLLRRRPGA